MTHQADVTIDYLGDHAELIPQLAEALQLQWREVWPERTLEWRIERLRAHMNRTSLPIGWVALDGAALLGTAALRSTDFVGFEQLSPWLGGVFVLPDFRGRGVGAELCAQVEQAAAGMGVEKLYLGTFDNQSWYQSLGWRLFEEATLKGRRCDVMWKPL